MNPGTLFNENEIESNGNNKGTILKIINSFPGIRYRDILRITNLNNGTLSHHLANLEKRSIIKIGRTEHSNITRYFPASTPSDETIVLNYMKIKTTKSIIMMLNDTEDDVSFSEIVKHINKAPSTTSWNLKRLVDSNVVGRKRGKEVSLYYLLNKELVKKLVSQDNKTLLDRSIDNYISIIDEL